MNVRYIWIVTFTFFSVANAQGITRESVISNAGDYGYLWWQVVTTNPKYQVYADSGDTIIGEAYSYGDKATTNTFLSEIAAGLIPRNWMLNPGVPANPPEEYTGIDCSGFVTRCWQFSEYLVNMTGANALRDYTIAVIGEPKTGDLWWEPGHVFLNYMKYSANRALVYETNPRDNPDGGNRAQLLDRSIGGCEARSIFPQFANEKPANGSETYERRPEISVEVTGSGVVQGTLFLLDGKSMSFEETPITNGKKIRCLLGEDLADGNHTVEIRATNNKVNLYEDTYIWSFAVHSECPVVIFTDPAQGAENVDIYKKIKLVFNKPIKDFEIPNSNPPRCLADEILCQRRICLRQTNKSQ